MIKTDKLTKVYGELHAVHELTLDLDRGDVFGYIGPNGSGKTTTMRMLATLLQPSWGEATICDYSIYNSPREIRRLVGYMPDMFGVYDDMKVIEYLEFFAAAYRIRGDARRKRCEEMLALVDLGYKRDALVTSLSRGMTQRLGLARVLLHDPEVLLLDEPASGLDPRARIEIRQLLKELRSLGKTIMVSSHILPELADVCNKIGIIERGELLISAEVTEVIKRVRTQPLIEIGVTDRKTAERSATATVDAAAKLLDTHDLVDSIEVRDGKIYALLKEGTQDYSDLSIVLVNAGFGLTVFREDEINLETAFMALTKGITA